MTIYSKRLLKEPEKDVLLALEKLAEMQRKEYESAIPDIGTLLALVETCTIARCNREEAARGKREVTFICGHCGHTESAFLTPDQIAYEQSRVIYCKSIYGPIGSRKCLERGTICGHTMKVDLYESYDEAIARAEEKPSPEAA